MNPLNRNFSVIYWPRGGLPRGRRATWAPGDNGATLCLRLGAHVTAYLRLRPWRRPLAVANYLEARNLARFQALRRAR